MKRRIAALLGAPNLGALIGAPGKLHRLHADRDGQFALHLWGSYRLILEPAPEFQLSQIDHVELNAITAVQIVEVVDYHGR